MHNQIISATAIGKALNLSSSQIPNRVCRGDLPLPDLRIANRNGYAWTMQAIRNHNPAIADRIEAARAERIEKPL
jgi:hypothetical protein